MNGIGGYLSIVLVLHVPSWAESSITYGVTSHGSPRASTVFTEIEGFSADGHFVQLELRDQTSETRWESAADARPGEFFLQFGLLQWTTPGNIQRMVVDGVPIPVGVDSPAPRSGFLVFEGRGIAPPGPVDSHQTATTSIGFPISYRNLKFEALTYRESPAGRRIFFFDEPDGVGTVQVNLAWNPEGGLDFSGAWTGIGATYLFSNVPEPVSLEIWLILGCASLGGRHRRGRMN